MQASAQALQLAWWSACLLHSSAQAVQILAQRAQRSLWYAEPLPSKRAQSAQMSAQSLQRVIHCWLPDLMQSVMQISQAIMQAKQLWIQGEFVIYFVFLLLNTNLVILKMNVLH